MATGLPSGPSSFKVGSTGEPKRRASTRIDQRSPFFPASGNLVSAFGLSSTPVNAPGIASAGASARSLSTSACVAGPQGVSTLNANEEASPAGNATGFLIDSSLFVPFATKNSTSRDSPRLPAAGMVPTTRGPGVSARRYENERSPA